MNDDAPMIAELGVLLAVMTDGTLSTDQRARLVTLLREHPEARHFYKRYIELHVMLEWESGVAIEAPDDNTVLLELLQAERDAETFVLPQPARLPQPVAVSSSGQMTWREVGSAAAYLCGRPQAWGALAALLALAVVLVIVLLPSTEPSPVANNPIQDVRPPVATVPVVATLTATHDATWVEGALAPGSQLRAGDRLTLTAGFAEITTNDGTIAFLEAPTKIELLDNDNALRLHSGKLVGICETESSKGFLVRTPQMDITDLGTRFGVAIDVAGNTLAEVFEGSVLAEPSAHARGTFDQQQMGIGDVLAVNRFGQVINRDPFTPDVFIKLNALDHLITELEGQAQWSPNTFSGTELQNWPVGPDAFVIEEVRGFRLPSAAVVTIDQPGTHLRFEGDSTTSTIAAGNVIRSYVVMFNPGSDRARGPYTAQGSVQFAGEILGITTNTQHWDAFADVAKSRSEELIPALKHMSGLEHEGSSKAVTAELADRIELSEDRRTLGFKFSVLGNPEAVRVFVSEPVRTRSN